MSMSFAHSTESSAEAPAGPGAGLRNARYDTRPPSPPYIHVPSIAMDGSTSLTITPSYAQADSTSLTEDDLRIITQGREQIARDNTHEWQYESRRHAQPILDFLFLGPSNAAKDRAFLAREGITMLLACRDALMADTRLMSAERVAQELGLETFAINTTGKNELIAAIPQANRAINDHLLRVYRAQLVPGPPGAGQGQMMIDASKFRRGKVLVFCETGNDRSAAIVAGYLMSMFGLDIVKAVQFVCIQRFCASFDDETKNVLLTYRDILKARGDVAAAAKGGGGVLQENRGGKAASFANPDQAMSGLVGAGPAKSKTKRHVEDMMMGDDDEGLSYDSSGMVIDRERHVGRNFAPFGDGASSMETDRRLPVQDEQTNFENYPGGDPYLRFD